MDPLRLTQESHVNNQLNNDEMDRIKEITHHLVTYSVRDLSEHLLYKIKNRVTPVLQADSNPLGSTSGKRSLNQF